jgi:hypothetical protein
MITCCGVPEIEMIYILGYCGVCDLYVFALKCLFVISTVIIVLHFCCFCL